MICTPIKKPRKQKIRTINVMTTSEIIFIESDGKSVIILINWDYNLSLKI